MEYITKKELLEETGISYGQLYRWKRMGLIPENWFIKRPASTGQETILPRKKIINRITEITTLAKTHSMEQLAAKYSFDSEKDVISFEDLYKSPYLQAEYVNAVGNYFKKAGYTACEYMMIICCARVARSERFTTRQYVDLLRYALPVAQSIKNNNVRCIFFAAGGDYHLCILENSSNITFDSGLRVAGNFNFEAMWEKLQ